MKIQFYCNSCNSSREKNMSHFFSRFSRDRDSCQWLICMNINQHATQIFVSLPLQTPLLGFINLWWPSLWFTASRFSPFSHSNQQITICHSQNSQRKEFSIKSKWLGHPCIWISHFCFPTGIRYHVQNYNSIRDTWCTADIIDCHRLLYESLNASGLLLVY